MKRSWLVIREIQIKTGMKCQFIPNKLVNTRSVGKGGNLPSFITGESVT